MTGKHNTYITSKKGKKLKFSINISADKRPGKAKISQGWVIQHLDNCNFIIEECLHYC